MSNRPLFLTIDGPNGIGKSTIAVAIAAELRALGASVFHTREPTNAAIGSLCRSSEESIGGRTLACLVAADRYWHVEYEILPALRSGDVVVCDRYVESSLVLQSLDGVDIEFIWVLNRAAPIPDLSVELVATPEMILQRRHGRLLTRFEREHPPEVELSAYSTSAAFLDDHGYHTYTVNADGDVNSVVDQVLRHMRAKLL